MSIRMAKGAGGFVNDIGVITTPPSGGDGLGDITHAPVYSKTGTPTPNVGNWVWTYNEPYVWEIWGSGDNGNSIPFTLQITVADNLRTAPIDGFIWTYVIGKTATGANASLPSNHA